MRAMASTARRMVLALLALTGLPAALHAGETQFGILCNASGGTALIRNNAVIGAATPYLGCVPVGTTNFP